jgi:hypothetical protein
VLFLLHPPTKRAARWLSLALSLSHTHLFINDDSLSLTHSHAVCWYGEGGIFLFARKAFSSSLMTFKGNTSAAEIKRAKSPSEKFRESIDLSDQDLAF